jgi:hypothetical protein
MLFSRSIGDNKFIEPLKFIEVPWYKPSPGQSIGFFVLGFGEYTPNSVDELRHQADAFLPLYRRQ